MTSELFNRIKKRAGTDLMDACMDSRERGYLTDEFRKYLKEYIGLKFESLSGIYGREMRHYVYYKTCQRMQNDHEIKRFQHEGRYGMDVRLSMMIRFFSDEYRQYRLTDDKVKKLLDQRSSIEKEIELALTA